MGEFTRAEHLNWCKKRALEYVDNGDMANALVSMMSDLGKHTEAAGHAGIQLGMGLSMAGQLDTPKAMRKYIDGFN